MSLDQCRLAKCLQAVASIQGFEGYCPQISMIRYIADWVLPINGPVMSPGWVDVDGGTVVGLGSADSMGPSLAPVVSLGPTAVLPALVNAHTHLELSDLRGVIPPASSMPDWVGHLLSNRASLRRPDSTKIKEAIAEARASGTGLFGDIGNTMAAVPELAMAGVGARFFCEILAFPDEGAVSVVDRVVEKVCVVARTDGLRFGLAAHAPFSVGRSAFEALGEAARTTVCGPRSIHLAESPQELEFLKTGGGPWRELLERLGRWDPSWVVPECGPVEYLDRLGWLDGNLVAVHGVQLTDAELDLLAKRGATLVTCPRSNEWTGVGHPPISRFIRSGIRLAVGTDSLASVPDLNLFTELRQMRRLAPEVPAHQLLACATVAGAEALGFGEMYGTITRGHRAALIGVKAPAAIGNVEEYLLGGIDPGQVFWLEQE